MAIARSLVNDPRFMLADEPTGNLDSATTEEILQLLERLNDEGRTIILVTHENDVAEHTKRTIMLRDGADPVRRKAASVTRWWRTLKLSVKSLLLHPLRSALTVLGIFIGVAGVIWLLSIGEGIGRAAEEQIAGLGARNIIVRTIKPSADEVQDGGYGLTRDDYQRLLSTIGTIEKAVPIREVTREFR